LKNSLSGVSLWAWGLRTPSHICSKMRTAQVTENTKGAIENKISRSIPSECLLLKLVQDFLGVSVRNQKELILIDIQTIQFEKENTGS